MKTKTITINVEEDVEERFRKLASVIYGKKKGYLGKALTEAMKEWEKKKVETNHVTKAMLLLEKGVKMKKWKFDRDELHER
jgi:predicted transcriptional regulator